MSDRKSAIGTRKSVNPPAVFGNKDRQFFHHELRLPEGADHVGASRGVPLLRHALARVAAPALNVSAACEGTATDLFQIVFMQPGLTSAIDVVAVIEHETSTVRMTEVFEIRDLQLVSWLSVVQIIDDLLARAKPIEIDIKFVAIGTNYTDQIMMFLLGTALIALPVKDPS